MRSGLARILLLKYLIYNINYKHKQIYFHSWIIRNIRKNCSNRSIFSKIYFYSETTKFSSHFYEIGFNNFHFCSIIIFNVFFRELDLIDIFCFSMKLSENGSRFSYLSFFDVLITFIRMLLAHMASKRCILKKRRATYSANIFTFFNILNLFFPLIKNVTFVITLVLIYLFNRGL